MLNLQWRHPATVLWGLVAAYLATTYWLIETCRDGKPKFPQAAMLLTTPIRTSSRIPATARARNVLVLIGVCLWTAAVSVFVRLGWHAAIGMADWQTGLLLFVGFDLVLVGSVLLDVRLPGGG
jgi:hypothetical protein